MGNSAAFAWGAILYNITATCAAAILVKVMLISRLHAIEPVHTTHSFGRRAYGVSDLREAKPVV